jgi:hypothetical protein
VQQQARVRIHRSVPLLLPGQRVTLPVTQAAAHNSTATHMHGISQASEQNSGRPAQPSYPYPSYAVEDFTQSQSRHNLLTCVWAWAAPGHTPPQSGLQSCDSTRSTRRRINLVQTCIPGYTHSHCFSLKGTSCVRCWPPAY